MFSPKKLTADRSPQYDFIQSEIRSEHPAHGEHPPVIVRLPLHRFRIGPRRRGHAIKPKHTVRIGELHTPSHRRLGATGKAHDHIGSLLSRRHDRPAGRNRSQQLRQIDLAHYLKKIVGSIVFQSDYLFGRIVKSQSFLLAETHDPFLVETFRVGCQKIPLVPEKYQSDDTPHIVLQVRVKKVHRPPHPLRRETSEHQQTCPDRQKRFERMQFACHNF